MPPGISKFRTLKTQSNMVFIMTILSLRDLKGGIIEYKVKKAVGLQQAI